MHNNTAFRLPFSFEADCLQEELRIALERDWSAHYNSADYAGSWESISLRSMSGKEDDARAFAGAQFHDTPLLEKLPYIQSVVRHFECPIETVRLLRLAAGSEIKEHRDPEGGYEDGYLRIHIPVQTNEQVTFIVGGENIPMKNGECWYADFNLPHSVKNESGSDRVHLVIDGVRNVWTDDLFRQCGYDFEAGAKKTRPGRDALQRMIDELRLQNTPAALQLAGALEKELAERTD
ncbi:MAG: Aspartyl/Asparaginyl beta-hydroxylase [Bacteroidetes bacterium]|nr:MAG: Aspartyl/Asparaginyl beta-hydroxylase [Bacteroidota bacterium]